MKKRMVMVFALIIVLMVSIVGCSSTDIIQAPDPSPSLATPVPTPVSPETLPPTESEPEPPSRVYLEVDGAEDFVG